MQDRVGRVLVAGALAMVLPLAQAQLSVERPWVRGIVAGQSSTGAFMTLHSTQAVELIGVSSPDADSVAVHRMVMSDSMMSMEPVESLPIPAGGTLELKPGAYHVMLVGLKHALPEGSEVMLTLTFRGADRTPKSISVQAPVRGIAAQPPASTM